MGARLETHRYSWPHVLTGEVLLVRAGRALRPWPSRPGATRSFALLVPLILWSLYFAATALRWGEAWPPELWAGITVMAGLSGVGLSLLMVPPPVPARA